MSILPFVFRRWRWLTGIAVLTALTSAVAALQPWPLKVLLDYGINDLSSPSILRVPLEAVGLSFSAVTMIFVAAALSIALFVLNSALTVGLSILWSMAG